MKKRKKTKGSKNSDKQSLDPAWLAVNQVIDLTNDFCKKYLNEEYRQLCEDLTWTVYEEDLPIETGKPSSWASGILHAIGWVNFLFDPSQSPHMTSAQLSEAFGVSQGTMMAKSRIIRDELDLIQLDLDWCTSAMLNNNPLAWMIEVNGFIMDARYAPPEIQQEAYRLGLIPYIPADEQEPKPEPDIRTKIIEFPSGKGKTSTPSSTHKQIDDEHDLFEKLEQ